MSADYTIIGQTSSARPRKKYHRCKMCNRRYCVEFADIEARQTIVAKCVKCGDMMQMVSDDEAETK